MAVREKLIASYVHHGRVGVLVEIGAPDDFTLRLPEVQEFLADLTLQVAALSPSDCDELLNQPFVKDQTQTVAERRLKIIEQAKVPIEILRFVRWDTQPSPPVSEGPEPAPPRAAQMRVVK